MNVGLLRTLAADAFGVATAPTAADDLTTRLRRGEVAALAQAYDQFHDQVRGFARRLVGDNAAAEDLVQEVFVTLPKAIQRYRGEAALGTFVMSIVVNHARHHVRAAARRRRMLEELSVQPRRTASSDPEHTAARRQIAAALSRALDTLPLEDRVAFVLCEVEDRPSAEVARILGVPDATVRSRLFRARRRLREQLASEEL
jgi:RNA polymerase sigma-70 factor (ECF subfamily)